jgi:AmiR/NasT family two-component response regulator
VDKVKLAEFIKQGVASLALEQAQKDYRSTLAADVKEVLEMSSSDFNARCKIAYDMHKAQEELEKREDAIAEVKSMGFY